MRYVGLGSMALLSSLCALSMPGHAQAPAVPAVVQTRQMLPDRTLDCILGRATNLNPRANQTMADVKFEGRYALKLFLPSIPVRTAPPPDPVDPAEPVDPRTRILVDSGKLTSNAPARFDRVVDYWPDRVELMTTVSDSLVNLFIVHPIDAEAGVANLFMTRARDAASYDWSKTYIGRCTVS